MAPKRAISVEFAVEWVWRMLGVGRTWPSTRAKTGWLQSEHFRSSCAVAGRVASQQMPFCRYGRTCDFKYLANSTRLPADKQQTQAGCLV